MRIDDEVLTIRARVIEIPAVRVMRNARGLIATQPLVLVSVATRQDIVGHAYLRCYTARASSALRLLVEEAGAVIVGRAVDTAFIGDLLAREFALIGRHGLVGMAIAGIDMALWDALSQAAGEPLWRLLGRDDGPIRAYIPLASMEPVAAACEAEAAAKDGFEGFKLKVGSGTLAGDLSAMQAVRSAVGWEAALMIDFNQSLDRKEARTRLAALAEWKPYWAEEPLDADDHAGCAILRAMTTIPIQLGENCWGAADLADALPGADHIAFDAARIGGVSGWLQALTVMPSKDRPVSNHAYCEIAAHLLEDDPRGGWIEWIDHAGSILQMPLEVSEGRVLRPTAAGAGMAPSEDAIRRLRM